MHAKFATFIGFGISIILTLPIAATELNSPVNVDGHRAIYVDLGSDRTAFFWGGRDKANFFRAGLNIGGDSDPPTSGLLIQGRTGIGTQYPMSALHVSGAGEAAEVTVAPDGENEASQLTMCQDSRCQNRSVLRYDGERNSFFLYFNNGLDNDRTALKVEHHANSAARVGINVPAEHDIRNELEVKGTILAEEIEVVANVADYVFDDGFVLMPLEDVDSFIRENHHLPGIPSEADVIAGGGAVPLGQAFTLLLQKIEELTLYAISQEKEIDALRQKNIALAEQEEKIVALRHELESIRAMIDSNTP